MQAGTIPKRICIADVHNEPVKKHNLFQIVDWLVPVCSCNFFNLERRVLSALSCININEINFFSRTWWSFLLRAKKTGHGRTNNVDKLIRYLWAPFGLTCKSTCEWLGYHVVTNACLVLWSFWSMQEK